MNTVYIINKNFLNPADMLNKIQQIAVKIKANFINDNNSIVIVKENSGKLEQLEFGGLNENYFLDSLNNTDFISNYGCVLTIDYDSEDVLFTQFIKELFDYYPSLLVYNDEGLPKNVNYYTYNKSHFDKFKGNNLYALLTSPPKDFGNMA